MIKYYTRACNFYYGKLSKRLVKNIKPTRSFKEEEENDGKTSSALGSLGLKPKPAI